ncbi:hypothetical protein LX36DRAFT_197194 [Colletotrichum falcatum]|nr:hypothetical protein LX36DRAFT_197194 [Colletotrichum falcatum]
MAVWFDLLAMMRSCCAGVLDARETGRAARDHGTYWDQGSWLVSSASKRMRHRISVQVNSWWAVLQCIDMIARVLQPFVTPEYYTLHSPGGELLFERHEREEHRAHGNSLHRGHPVSPVCRQGQGSSPPE